MKCVMFELSSAWLNIFWSKNKSVALVVLDGEDG